MSSRIDYLVQPGGRLTGALRVPGDKSISHRAVMLGALAEGTTRITGLLEGEDVLCTLTAFRAMGVLAKGPESGRLTIQGVGLRGLRPSAQPLDMGNSGTAMRLMAGILAGQTFDSTLIGDASLSQRPMQRVADPLSRMGARIETNAGGRPPLKIKGGQTLRGIDYPMPVASAQVKSALLFAGLYAAGETCVTEPAATRDHTERMLRGFGYAVGVNGARRCVRGGGRLTACDINVPADISSAAFFMVGASIASGSELTLEHVGINTTRTGVINILKLMGADIAILNPREAGGEPVADIRVRHAKLKGIVIPRDQVLLAIDEFPVPFHRRRLCRGRDGARRRRGVAREGIRPYRGNGTGPEDPRYRRARNAGRHRYPRRDVTRRSLRVSRPATLAVPRGGTVDSHGDHRIAMAFAIAALCADGPVTVRDCKNVDTSFPGFADLARRAGLDIEVK